MTANPCETSTGVGTDTSAAITQQNDNAVVSPVPTIPASVGCLNHYANANLLALCSLTETKIGHELNLINHRVSWLASSQAFLILGLITLLNGIPASPHPSVVALMIGIPIMGIAIRAQVWPAVSAAFEVLKTSLLPERELLMKHVNQQTGLPLIALGPGRFTDTEGAIPAKWIPLTFLICWIGLLEIVLFRLFS